MHHTQLLQDPKLWAEQEILRRLDLTPCTYRELETLPIWLAWGAERLGIDAKSELKRAKVRLAQRKAITYNRTTKHWERGVR